MVVLFEISPILYQSNIASLALPGKFSTIVVTWDSLILLKKRGGISLPGMRSRLFTGNLTPTSAEHLC
jgi:hypothetical protein